MKEPAQSVFVARIQSGSMIPTFHVGELITLQRVSFASIAVGDIVSFTSQRGIPLVHRVVWKTAHQLTTVADASRRADLPITEKAVMGKVTLVKRCGCWQSMQLTNELWGVGTLIAKLSGQIVKQPSSLKYRIARKILLYSVNMVSKIVCGWQKIVG